MLNLWNNNKLLQSSLGAWPSWKQFPDVNHVNPLNNPVAPHARGSPSFQSQNQVPLLFCCWGLTQAWPQPKPSKRSLRLREREQFDLGISRCCRIEDYEAGLWCSETFSSCLIVETRHELAHLQSHWEHKCIGTLIICQFIDVGLAALGGSIMLSPPRMFWSYECVSQRISKLVHYACVDTSIFKLHCLLT